MCKNYGFLTATGSREFASTLRYMYTACLLWSLAIKGKTKLRVFENSLLGKVRMFGFKREEVSGWGIKLHNEDRDLYSSNILGGVSE